MKQIKIPVPAVLIFSLLIQLIMVIPAFSQPFSFNIVAGEWARTDGNYTISVKNVKSSGSADVTYFNPNSIHVEESNISFEKGLVKLFVKLQDKGYPGSTYTLYYYAEKEALVGYYYQAPTKQTYKVIFLRKNT